MYDFGQFNNALNRRVMKMGINKVILSETGTYNPMYQRPYELDVQKNSLETIFNRMESTGGVLSGQLLAGAGCNIIMPSSNRGGNIHIPNGWNEKRIRFVLEVCCHFNLGNPVSYFVQGYTSFPGVNPQTGSIAPDMDFHVNSFVAVNQMTTTTPHGPGTRFVVAEQSQIMSDNNFASAMQGDATYMIRPVDIFYGMQTNYMADAHQYAGNAPSVDSRSIIRRDAIRSSRSSNIPTTYLANVIGSYCTATEQANFGVSEANIVGKAIENVFEAPVIENPFFASLAASNDMGSLTRFRWSDLEAIDPGVFSKTTYAAMDQRQLSKVCQSGQYTPWHGTDRTTVTASALMHAVPALMMETMFSAIAFTSNNSSIDGRMHTLIGGALSLTGEDLRRNYKIFIDRLEREVLFDLTYAGTESYTIEMMVDSQGESRLKLSIAGMREEEFVLPSFCDNLYAPVVAGGRDIYQNMVQSLDSLVNSLAETKVQASYKGMEPLQVNTTI